MASIDKTDLRYNNSNLSARDLMSFSPADITIYMGGRPMRSILSVTYSITREVVALFGLGDANAMGFNRGKRGIAGSLVMNTFQSHPMLRSRWANEIGIDQAKTLGDFASAMKKNKVNDNFKSTLDDYAFGNGTFQLGTNPDFSGGTFDMTDINLQNELNSTYSWVKDRKFNYVDQLPPFDIALTFVNEMGMAAVMSINNVILANEGGGFSVDDITAETAFTYIARSITPMRAFMPKGSNGTTNIKGF